ncbi:FecR family protein [Brenneria tiliae]|uniref:FecR domain-containing protein n=1 Tax=Brenneria tiliae TaxID=2914984 RepID=A0ABT0MPB0_9GAMM|nr:FecR domain-containing protein [Brenneria tiliae]MCL2891674.1 FecR domain-containing protein [Brenneria tiliae]
MTEKTSQDDKLFAEAFDLIIRQQTEPANPLVREQIRRWRGRDPSHEAVWAEAMDIHVMAGQVVQARRGASRAPAGISRRSLVFGGAAALAAWGVGSLVAPTVLLRARADHITATAELRRISLADGTLVALGPDSAIRSQFTPHGRRVELLSGMAFFEVAPDDERPFQALADDLEVAASGAFDLGWNAGFLSVAVERGRAVAASPGGGGTLAAGEWLTFDQESGGVERGWREPGRIALWRDGLLVVDRESVASVVARIARWQPGRVVIATPDLGRRRVSGVYNLTSPESALQAVVQPHGGTVRRLSSWLTVVS